MSLKWLDDLLHHPGKLFNKSEPETEVVSLEEAIDSIGTVDRDTDNNKMYDSNGKLIATIEADIDKSDGSFDLLYELRIPHETWERTTIVCDGNAVDVATDLAQDGRYIVRRTLRGFSPENVVEESEIELKEFANTKEFISYYTELEDDAIEALRQIYYDRWNFDTASQKDRTYYELLEEEKQLRK